MRQIISWSGGKDSTAMLLRMIEMGEQIDEIIFVDTGFEYPEMYEYIEKIKKYINPDITILKAGEELWDKWFYEKVTRGKYKGMQRGFPFVVNPCWFSREAKIKPLQKIQQNVDIVCIGIAFDEQNRVRENNKFRYPLIEWKWTEQDCAVYLEKKGMTNPLYRHLTRTGCWLCPKQSKHSLYFLWKYHPNLWLKLKQYEKDSPHGFKPNKTLNEYEIEFLNSEKNEPNTTNQ